MKLVEAINNISLQALLIDQNKHVGLPAPALTYPMSFNIFLCHLRMLSAADNRKLDLQDYFSHIIRNLEMCVGCGFSSEMSRRVYLQCFWPFLNDHRMSAAEAVIMLVCRMLGRHERPQMNETLF